LTRRGAAVAAAVAGLAIVAVVVAALVARGGDTPAIELPRSYATPAPGAYAKPLGTSVRLDAARTDAAYLRLWLAGYTSVTPENAMKWEVVEPSRNAFDFSAADAIVTAARRAGQRVRGHTLTWDVQLPGWVQSRAWTAADMELALRSHVRATVGHFRGRVAQWDVVNEPLDDDGSLTRSVFARVLGERFIDIAFDEAHRADPRAKLFLNEIATELPGPKQDALVALVRRLQARDVPIDGVGLQDHSVAVGGPDQRRLEADIARFARLGLDVELTEVDVAVRPGEPEAAQARNYRAAAAACRRSRACTGLTVWGVTDRWSWQGPGARATPFDAASRPKPAWRALRAAMRRVRRDSR